MKSNVDLTENRDFDKSRSGIIRLIALLGVDLAKYPWSQTDSFKQLDSFDERELVFTGNNTMRADKVRYSYSFGDQCERCGENLKHRFIKTGICIECDNEIEAEINEDPLMTRLYKRNT